MTPKISFCTIVKNEERCIGRCIDSLYGIADEIVVVDTGSTDRTVEIAKAHGAEIRYFTWIDDFAAAKNFALDQTTGEWVVFLDADEYFPDEHSAKFIVTTIEKIHKNPALHGLYHSLRNFTNEGGLAGNPDASISYNTRVYRHIPSIRYESAIHERITINGKDLNTLQVDINDSVIEHDGYLTSMIGAKEDRNLVLQLREIENGNKDPLLFYYTGRDYYHKENYSLALEYLKKYYDTGFVENCFSVSHYILHTNALILLNKPYMEALRVLRRGMREFPGHPGLELMNSFVLESAMRYPQALSGFEKGFSLLKTYNNPTEFTPNLMRHNHPRFYAVQAMLYKRKGNMDKMLETIQLSLAREPFYLPSLTTLCAAANSHSEAVLAFIDATYDTSNPDVLKELLSPLSTARPGVAYFTLFERYFQLTGVRDVYMFTMMAAIGEHSAAVNALTSRFEATNFEPYSLKALAIAILSGDTSLILAAAQRTAAPYVRMAKMALGLRPETQSGDLVAFVTIMHLALGLSGVTPALENFASFAIERFGKDALAQLVLLLYNHGLYQDALDIADMALDSLGAPQDALLCGAVADAAAESAYHAADAAQTERYILFAREHCGHPYLLGSVAAFAAEPLQKGADKKRLERLSQELMAVDLREENARRRSMLLLKTEDKVDVGGLRVEK